MGNVSVSAASRSSYSHDSFSAGSAVVDAICALLAGRSKSLSNVS